jgi:hypothetical protein
MAVETVTDVFAQTPASSDKTAIAAAVTTLLAALDTAVTNGKMKTNTRDVLHDNLLLHCQMIATNLTA